MYILYIYMFLYIYIYSHLYHFFCNHLKKYLVFSTTRTFHRMTSSSVKSITGVTFVGKCPWLVFLTYCLFCFFQWLQHLLVLVQCSSNVPYIKLGHEIVIIFGNRLTYGNREVMHQPENILFEKHMTILLLWIDSFWATNDIYFFLVLYSNFHVLSAFNAND